MRLYKISEKDISDTIESADVSSREGDKVVVLESFGTSSHVIRLKSSMKR